MAQTLMRMDTRTLIVRGSEPVEEELSALFDRVLAAYAAEGFAAHIIGQWTLPAEDAIDLVAWRRNRT
jgi:hypothetical protein